MNANRFWGVILAIMLVVLAAGGALAWSIRSAGMLTVDVHSKGPGGDRFAIRIPAAFAHVALGLAPACAFDWSADEELEFVGPLIREACRQLADCPDFTLVEVRSHRERVRVRKEGPMLVVDVNDRNERVRVTLPLGVAEAFARKIERHRRFI